MRALVTGAAGFVGSHLCRFLLSQGDEVVGLDAFTEYYDPARKEANVADLLDGDRFVLVRSDLRRAPLETLLDRVDIIYHLAGQPGGQPSWGDDFTLYVSRNVVATQRLLEAVSGRPVRKLVFASSASVYGDAEAHPTAETILPRPPSPYAVTKLAAEQLCELYHAVYGVPAVSLRLFTVYGPAQRPDMALGRLVDAAVCGEPFFVYGDGEQTRDFTHVDDVVRAMRAAAIASWTGIANVGSGSGTSLNEVIRILRALGEPVHVLHLPARPGELRHARADNTIARKAFGYRPTARLAEELARLVGAARLDSARLP